MTFLQTIVTIADLENLIENEVREGLHLEYKEAMPGKAVSDKVPFLAAVSAFANTSGGDFYLGIAADDGLPTAITGIKCPEVDKEILRLEWIIRNGLEPPISGVGITPIKINDNHVFRINIPRSWNAPHRVKNNAHFYARNSAGKYQMDVSEIRNALLLTSGIEDKIRDFRLGRIARISARDTPFPIIDGAIAILHIITLQTFTGNWNFPLEEVYQMIDDFQPIETSGFSRQTNLDGVLFYSGGFKEEEMVNYTQVFRNGVVEAIEIYPSYGNDKSIPIIHLEQNLNESMERYIKSLLKLDLRLPFVIFISLINLTGFTFATGRFRRRFAKSPNIPNGMILCPDILLETVVETTKTGPLEKLVWVT